MGKKVGRFGDVDWWPSGIFREALDEVVGIQVAARPRVGDVIDDGTGSIAAHGKLVAIEDGRFTFEDGHSCSSWGGTW